MLSIYIIAMWWIIATLAGATITLGFLADVQTKSKRYTKYQQDQLRLANQKVRENVTAEAARFLSVPSTGFTVTVPDGHHVIITDSEGNTYGATGYTGPAFATAGPPVGVSGVPSRRRNARVATPKPRTRKKKEPTPEPAPLVPVSPEDAFYDDLRME
jgi:hypothetical protein